MANRVTCKTCERPMPQDLLIRSTNAQYCGDICRDEYWKLKRRTNVTWGDWCNERYGEIEQRELSEPELAWLACAVDGEGTIGIYRERRPRNRSGYRFYATVQVFNTELAFLEKFAELTGAFTAANGKPRKGHKQTYKAALNRRAVAPILKQLLPHLVIKREQAKIVLEFCELMENATRRTEELYPDFERLWLANKKLNKRGT